MYTYDVFMKNFSVSCGFAKRSSSKLVLIRSDDIMVVKFYCKFVSSGRSECF